MTDNEIKKALECCQDLNDYTCDDCPYQEIKHFHKEKGFEIMPNGMTYDTLSCDMWLQKDTLDLINRRQAEKDFLKTELSNCEFLKKELEIDKKNLEAENERLEKENKNLLLKLCKKVNKKSKAIENFIKAEAYKEFAELLFEKAERRNHETEEYHYVLADDIVDLYKELVGEGTSKTQ